MGGMGVMLVLVVVQYGGFGDEVQWYVFVQCVFGWVVEVEVGCEVQFQVFVGLLGGQLGQFDVFGLCFVWEQGEQCGKEGGDGDLGE